MDQYLVSWDILVMEDNIFETKISISSYKPSSHKTVVVFVTNA
jgi:hypothetical protein